MSSRPVVVAPFQASPSPDHSDTASLRFAITGSALVTHVFGPDTGESDKRVALAANPRRHATQRRLNPLEEYAATHGQAVRASDLLVQAVARALHAARLLRKGLRWAVILSTGPSEQHPLERSWIEGPAVAFDQLHFEDSLNAALGSAVPVLTMRGSDEATGSALTMAKDFLAVDAFDAVVAVGRDALAESLLERLAHMNLFRVGPMRRIDIAHGTPQAQRATAVVIETAQHASKRGAAHWGITRASVCCGRDDGAAPVPLKRLGAVMRGACALGGLELATARPCHGPRRSQRAERSNLLTASL